MRLLPNVQPLRVLLSAGGALALGLLFMGHPEAERSAALVLAPVYAEPAERVEVRSLRSGQTLGEVLAQTLDAGEQNALLVAFQERASPRRMRVGTEVTLRYGVADASLRGVDVALNPDSTVRLTRNGAAWQASTVETPVWTDTIYAAGTIEDVLWNAVVGNPALEELPPQDRAQLIHHMDQVFQWQIDFSRQIQTGDYYRFAFERRVRPDGSMRSGHLVAAELVNSGASFHAIWFDPNDDGEGTYYDLEGKSVRRAFLMKPLEFRRISSRFSGGRFHPILQTWRAHRGVDYAADAGTPIMATGDGVITLRGRAGGLGNAVAVRHTNGFLTRYGHMSRFAAGQAVGTRVRQGDIIGYVGATGLATGPHLHYEMHRNGQPIDPMSVQLPSGDPVPGDALGRWSSELLGRLALLEVLPGPHGVRVARGEAGPEPVLQPGSGAEGPRFPVGDGQGG